MDYARRKHWARPEAERWLGPCLGYEAGQEQQPENDIATATAVATAG